MNFYVLTLFPKIIEDGTNYSIMKRGKEKNLLRIEIIDIRNFANNKHRQVDDTPYGGGSGMVMKPEPIFNAYKHIERNIKGKYKVVYMTPQGKPLTQKTSYNLTQAENIIILCGHYEGVDQRVLDEIVTDEISIGDYVLTGGELPALVLIDSVSRLIDGVLSNPLSHLDESFSKGLLEHPQYTRPYEFLNKKVPDVLLSGNHKDIKKWRDEQSLKYTYEKRPDLITLEQVNEQ